MEVISELEKALCYTFRNKALLQEALTHSSFSHEGNRHEQSGMPAGRDLRGGPGYAAGGHWPDRQGIPGRPVYPGGKPSGKTGNRAGCEACGQGGKAGKIRRNIKGQAAAPVFLYGKMDENR